MLKRPVAFLFLSFTSACNPSETGAPTPDGTGGATSHGSGGALASGGSGSGGGPIAIGTGGAGTGGSGTGGATPSGGSGAGGSSPSGGSNAAGGTASGTGGESARLECPAAPPAGEKSPASDRSLAVSKSAYSELLTKEAPFSGTRGDLPYHLYEPPEAQENPNAGLPLLLVLHGGYGREVTDGNIMVDVAQYLLGSKNGLLTESNRSAYPTYILLPHCRVDEGCSFGSNEWASAGGAHFELQAQPSVAGGTALELLEHIIDSYPIDPTRVYLTGNSMGGGGTWEFASRRPELFAAVLPVSGHPPADQFLIPIAQAKLPVWAFGAENDSTNPYTDTVNAVGAINSANGCSWLTTYLGAGHDDALWSSPYLEPEIWSWLFAQSNPSAP